MRNGSVGTQTKYRHSSKSSKTQVLRIFFNNESMQLSGVGSSMIVILTADFILSFKSI